MATRKKQVKNRTNKIVAARGEPKIVTRPQRKSFWVTLLIAVGAATVCFLPMLKNDFTNWDDEVYVIKNSLLRGPDWTGIFTTTISSNYHPLTIISLALNYQISGLHSWSYLLFNLLLHLINTALVFYLVWLLSGKKLFVCFFAALVFGIHPMHVESVSWISERKDVLYTLFFLLSLIKYWRFLESGERSQLWACFLFFVVSLLSKPAAIVLPLVLLLLDFWKGRPLQVKRIFEKVPFFLMAILFGIITVQIQSQKAMTSLEVFPIWARLFFATYGIMIYFVRFFIPYPLSAFHPYPSIHDLGWPVLVSPVFVAALFTFTWIKRKNKALVFGILFFVINLLLVLQLVAIGYTIVSERYTYVPYIGLAFLFGLFLNEHSNSALRIPLRIGVIAVLLIFGVISFRRTVVWKNSDTLWTDVIKHYTNAAIPYTNRASYFYVKGDSVHSVEANYFFEKTVADCDNALNIDPNFQTGYETRGLALLKLNRDKEAMADGDALIKKAPDRAIGYSMAGTAAMHLNEFEKAIERFNTCLKIDPKDHGTFNKRGAILYNHYKEYKGALEDFNKAIELSPQPAYFLNRSRCYYLLGDTSRAKADVQFAIQNGVTVSAEYKKLLNL
ncbi:MAG TPA: hypothetical protein VFP87_12475 [Chitinophagaceae bacterium]|nr:hypothetical protein [Chitinophagaceae bacterium]